SEYFSAISRGDANAVVGAFADDVTWWVPPSSPMAGLYKGKEAVLGLFAKGVALYAPGVPMTATVDRLVAEGNFVAAEVKIKGKSAKGRDYDNHYHFLFEIKNGKVKGVKEYVDTLYAQRVLFE
ncbi:MAG: nuclear transport factor 2 family protein, partial [Thermoplasmata archaeon]